MFTFGFSKSLMLFYRFTLGVLDHVMFSHFQQGFKTCGGINIPKVVVALAMDGRKKRHLVKGKDDLRQDAVMQQVDKVFNSFCQVFLSVFDLPAAILAANLIGQDIFE